MDKKKQLQIWYQSATEDPEQEAAERARKEAVRVTKSSYFPDSEFATFFGLQYEKALRELQEPAIYPPTEECYRYLLYSHWKGFERKVVRVVQTVSGALAIVKLISGYSNDRQIDAEIRTELSSDDWNSFRSLFEKGDFWDIKTFDIESMGIDGGNHIVEAVVGGKYHVVDRWSPGDVLPFLNICRKFQHLLKQATAGLDLPRY